MKCNFRAKKKQVKKMLLSLVCFVDKFLNTLLFFVELILKEGLAVPMRHLRKCHRSNVALVLGNGPSLRQLLARVTDGVDLNGADSCGVNFFAESNAFEVFQPKHYVLSDTSMFCKSPLQNRCRELYACISSKTKWAMNLYVPIIEYRSKTDWDWRQEIKNKHVTIIPYHSVKHNGEMFFKNAIMAIGYGSGEYGTVVHNALYIMAYLRYDSIFAYGIDHNFFDGLCVDDENRLMFEDSHYYSDKPKRIPLVVDGSVCSVARYLQYRERIFRGHEVLDSFAKSVGCKIYNATPVSLVDAYDRKQFI